MGNHAVALQQLFHSWDLEARIFASHIEPDAASNCHPSSAIEELVQPDDVVILHYGGYAPELQAFSRLRAHRVLAYHNITPPRFFVNHGLRHYYETALGRLQLPQAVEAAEQCWTESMYNKRELDVLGARDCRFVPLLLKLEALDAVEPDAAVLSKYGDAITNLIFVGRLVPNKRQDNVISTFVRYHREFNRNSRLILIGRHEEIGTYYGKLQVHAKRLGVEDCIVFTGHVTLAELVAYYRVASVFLCLSEHEGFGAPLVEAMHMGIPVVALARAAVPETLGGAGVLVDDVEFDAIAQAIHRLCSDMEYRRRIVAALRRRAGVFAPSRVAGILQRYLAELDR